MSMPNKQVNTQQFLRYGS